MPTRPVEVFNWPINVGVNSLVKIYTEGPTTATMYSPPDTVRIPRTSCLF